MYVSLLYPVATITQVVAEASGVFPSPQSIPAVMFFNGFCSIWNNGNLIILGISCAYIPFCSIPGKPKSTTLALAGSVFQVSNIKFTSAASI